jgi:hypothetical protein
LGGAIEGGPIARDRGEVSIYSAAERVTKALQLLRQHPELPFIFSGYSGRLVPQGPSEADAFKQLLQEQGLGSHPGYYENQSRNTYENMLYSKKSSMGLQKKRASHSSPGYSLPLRVTCCARYRLPNNKVCWLCHYQSIIKPVSKQVGIALIWLRGAINGIA